MQITYTASEVMQNALIMMVDDEPIMLDLLQMFLEEYGYKRFIGLSDSTQAISEINKQQPDVLLLDLVMPDVGGFEILERLRSNPETQHTPVIVLTSSNSNGTMLQALALGATDFLAKPVDQSELALRLRNTLTFKAYQDRLKFFDELTGLPNRRKFSERIGSAITASSYSENNFSVVIIKIAELNELTETYGTSFRDDLIKQVADNLLHCLRDSDLITHGLPLESANVTAHVKSDAFSICLTRINGSRDASLVCERLLSMFAAPTKVNETEVFLNVGLGISIFPQDGLEAEQLLSKAEVAANKAFLTNNTGYLYYSEQENRQLRRATMLQQELRKTIISEQLYLQYQPQIDTLSEKIKGAEALLRWEHSEMGVISPEEFIPVAENAGLMKEIGEFVFRLACRQSVDWEKRGLKNMSISVNVSGQQFNSPLFAEKVKQVLLETGANPKNIIIEITESLSLSDLDFTLEVINALHKLDLEVSVDDFGTGYSSLSYLKDLPIDELKIDKAFIDGIPDTKGDRAIVLAIVTMSKALGYKIVAEGVENKSQFEYLKELGCDIIQGYYFSKPLSPDDFVTYCETREMAVCLC
ncbi:EAL domain-containing protein [Psychromonas sp.]|uniref:GGDEF/EAL domain-containing response regulator n=1 Tax=Psychromonas sp. TaxID=1884585 RepID=UPI0035667B83